MVTERPIHPRTQELWDGPRAGVQGAQRHFLPEGTAHALTSASEVLHAELHAEDHNVRALFYAPTANPVIDAMLRPMLDGAAPGRRLPAQAPARHVEPLRARKSEAEIALMRRSANVCADAMGATMQASLRAASGGLTESVLAAQFEFEVRVAGAERLAYPCVVAGGANAVTLHYMHNNDVLRPESMVLMDAGCSLHGYCSDLTRTWPLDGTYSEGQRALYEAVLDVNERVIEACVADGRASLHTLHRLSVQWTYEHLVRLGILQAGDRSGPARSLKYYPHAIGHWLGLDVHDTPSVSSSLLLEPGMVVTVEPGLYFPADDPQLPEWCRGIGIRIEDDVLINPAGQPPEVLTRNAPKRPDDVEALMRQ